MVHSSLVLLLVAFVPYAALKCLKDDSSMKLTKKAREELLQSQLQFSVDLLQTVGDLQDSSNVFFSPSSVYNSLLLAYFVSANQTEASLKDTLRLPESQDKQDTIGAFNLLKYQQKLRSINSSLNYKLKNANRMFVSSGQKIRPCIKEQFLGEIDEVDFSKNVSAAIMRINTWVSEQTQNNINDLLSPDSLNSNTNLVLVNAAYFRGFWKHPFSTSENREATFTLANGTTVPVTLMTQENNFSHRVDENLEAEVLELPYDGDGISMFILLPLKPSATAISELLNKTDTDTLLDVVTQSADMSSEVSVAIPKFSVDETLELTPILESMGVGDLFESTADLSSLTETPGLRLDTAVHKAKITVDETGTEAAAATAIFANRFASDSFLANHPFVYFIFDKTSNIMLFAGIFNSPGT